MTRRGFDAGWWAVVLGLFDTGLGVARSLGRVGVPVLGLDPDARMPGFKSRYCIARTCPDPVHEPADLLATLLATGRQLDRPAVLYPTTDAFVLFVSRFRDDLAPYFRFVLPTVDVLEALANKRRQYELAERTGTPCPRTFYPETMADVQRVQAEVEYPCFVKPYYGYLWRERFGGTSKGFMVTSPRELVECFDRLLQLGEPAMVQAIIPGPNTNLFETNMYFAATGEPLAVFSWQKIRQYPTDFGVGSLVVSVPYPQLTEMGLRLCQRIGYVGVASIEFKRDARDGQLYLIELNPRLWQQNAHAAACGMNFSLLAYLDLTGQHPERLTEFKAGVKWLDAGSDFQAFWEYFRRGELSVRAWLGSWRGTRAFATFAWDDPGPFLQSTQYGLKYLRLPVYLLRRRATVVRPTEPSLA